MSGAWSSLAGYDRGLVGRLRGRAPAELDLLAGAWCWAALALAAPMAYAAALLTHSAWLSLGVAVGALLLLLTLVRLTVAGGGRPLTTSAYRPSWMPLIWLGLLAALFSLPAQLPLWNDAHARLVAERRASLLAQHQRAVGASAEDPYVRELASCEFVVLRLNGLWQEPARAARYALGYLALVLAPLLFARAQAHAALGEYDRLKANEVQRLVQRDAHSSRARLQTLLQRYPTYEPSRVDPWQGRERE